MEDLSMAEMAHRIIRHRRSMYPPQYSEVPISDAIINTILENANYAPMHKLTYPWRFSVFSGAGREKLAKFQSTLYKEKSTADGNFDISKFESLAHKPLSASHIIAIGMKRNDKAIVPEIEEIAAVACAVQNMYLTACAFGLGAYWGTGGITYFEEAKLFFGLEGRDKLMGFFYLGNLKTDKWPEGKRKDVQEFVEWVR